MKLSVSLVVFVGLLSLARESWAQICTEPTASQKLAVAQYVSARNHLGSATNLNLIRAEKTNESCYWTFQFQATSIKQLTVYLSPDRKYLTTELLDLRSDPEAEQRQIASALLATLTMGDAPALGPANAPVTIVEFSDFECPFCEHLKTIIEKEVLPKHPGTVRIVFKNFPLSMHPWAKSAAMLAGCAELQKDSEFWKVHDYLFDNQKALTSDNIGDKVTDFVSLHTSLDLREFKKCMERDLALGIITKDMNLGQQNGVRATPTAFINGVRYEGVQSAAQLNSIIDSLSGERLPLLIPRANNGGNSAQQCSKPPASGGSR